MKTLTLLLSLTLLAPALRAHDGHNHEAAVEAAPHGGVLRDAPPFKSELTVEGDDVTLYVYDKALQPVSLDQETLKGEVQFPRQKRKGVSFKRDGAVYKANIPGLSKVHRYDLHVTLEIGGNMAVADFGIDNVH